MLSKKEEVLAIVPARGGSKGIPRKNLRLVNHKPLIAYTLEQATASTKITRLIISTDDDEIAEVGKSYGVEAPFIRPANLSDDHASQIDVTLHAMRHIQNTDSKKYDIVLLLQPTAPLRTTTDINNSLDLILEGKADSVISVYKASDAHPYYMYTLQDNHPIPLLSIPKDASRRQDFPDVFVRNGALYAARWNMLMEKRTFYGNNLFAYIMERERSINIDNEFDLLMADFLITKNGAWAA